MDNYQEQEPVTADEIRDDLTAQIGISQIDLKAPPRLLVEVMSEVAPSGTASKLSEWVDQDIVIHSLRFFKGRYGNAAYVLFTDVNGELYNCVCSQKVVLPKLAAIAESLPVQAHVVKKESGQFGRYYDLE
jgi:hypothetical protein